MRIVSGGERQGSLGQMRLNSVQSCGCQGLQAIAPTTEPAMVPGDAAPLEEPDTASLEGPLVVAGAFVGRGAIEGGAVGRGAGAGAGAGAGVGRGAGASIGSSTT
jgi:hypothetical protein